MMDLELVTEKDAPAKARAKIAVGDGNGLTLMMKTPRGIFTGEIDKKRVPKDPDEKAVMVKKARAWMLVKVFFFTPPAKCEDVIKDPDLSFDRLRRIFEPTDEEAASAAEEVGMQILSYENLEGAEIWCARWKDGRNFDVAYGPTRFAAVKYLQLFGDGVTPEGLCTTRRDVEDA